MFNNTEHEEQASRCWNAAPLLLHQRIRYDARTYHVMSINLIGSLPDPRTNLKVSGDDVAVGVKVYGDNLAVACSISIMLGGAATKWL